MLTQTLLLLLLSVIPVRVSTIEGQSVQGDFQGIGTAELKIEVDGQTQTYGFDALSSLAPAQKPEETGPTMRVILAAGSEVAAQDLSLTDETLSIEPRRQNRLDVPVKQVRAIRFRAATAAVNPAWLAKLEDERRGDTIAIRREGDTLDFIEGVITSISADTVGLELDGDEIQAPIAKLEGVIFGGTKVSSNPGDIQVVDVYGSRWSVAEMLPSEADAPLRLRLPGGIIHTLPLAQIESIRWTGGLSLLATVKPAASSHTEYVQTKLDRNMLNAWFGPKPVDGQDLVLYGRSAVEYRIDEGFQTFAAGVRRDKSVRNATETTVRVFVDEKMVWEESINDDQPLGFELSVADGQRLKIEVDPGSQGDLGNTIRILRPRLLR
ncbi:NPCBM/NEW2 domain-containing protein [Novipirellula caenicola]|uniref:Glycosyl hydrolase family 98 putative carbohydrate-binding module domain-containing protein n=1 Tax=Novipirellula caenicola TaxID=1536901 RepID=A0ABP9W3A6_9BACT